MNYSITQFGKPLSKSKYTIDEEHKIFFSKENDLVLNFKDLHGWSFKINSDCTLIVGCNCTLCVGCRCNLKTGDSCSFKTDSYCTFVTGWDCTFNVQGNCIFNTGCHCNFNAGYNCDFNVGKYCSLSLTHCFNEIKTEGDLTISIWDRKIHNYLEDKIEIYFDYRNSKILYTENKLTEDKYLMMKELMK